MRVFLTAVLLSLVGGCRCSGDPSPSVAAAAGGSAASPSSSASAAPAASVARSGPRARRPVDAVLRNGNVVTVAAQRDSAALVVTEHGPSAELVGVIDVPTEDPPTDLDIIASSSALLVLADGASVRSRVGGDLAALGSSAWEPAASATCATADGFVSLARGETTLVVSERQGDGAVVTHPAGSDSASPHIVCSPRGAFVVREDGARRTVARVGATRELPFTEEAGEERAFSLHADGDGVLAFRVDARGTVAWRTARDAAVSPWMRGTVLAADALVELVVVGESSLGLVISHPVPAARPCRGEATDDVVAELMVFDRETGRLRREAQVLDRWTCSNDAGAFFGGVTSAGVLVAWPRGVDAACARLGVRHGGLTYAVARGDAPAKIHRMDAPASEIIDAGCDGTRCAVALLSRSGARGNACVGADAPEAGLIRVLFYP